MLQLVFWVIGKKDTHAHLVYLGLDTHREASGRHAGHKMSQESCKTIWPSVVRPLCRSSHQVEVGNVTRTTHTVAALMLRTTLSPH